MLRWFPRLQVATACFWCSPPDLNLLDPYSIFMYMHNNHCHRSTAHLQLNIIIIIFNYIVVMVIIYSKIAHFINLLLIFENNSQKTDIWPFLSTGVLEETSTINDSFLKHRHWISYCADLQGGDLQAGPNKEESNSHDDGSDISSL